MYFSSFNRVPYLFGTETTPSAIQNLTTYADMFDQIKDNISFYKKEYIQEGERPDQLSLRLYDTVDYYWTFYFLNDSLKSKGWPIDQQQMINTIKDVFPNYSVTVRIDITSKFSKGQDIIGQTSGARGTIVHKNFDMGQLLIKLDPGSAEFQVGEIARSVNISSEVQTAELFGASYEYLAPRYYYSGKDVADFDPLQGPGALLTEKTYLDTWVEQNDELRQINVVRPDYILELESTFQKAVSET